MDVAKATKQPTSNKQQSNISVEKVKTGTLQNVMKKSLASLQKIKEVIPSQLVVIF